MTASGQLVPSPSSTGALDRQALREAYGTHPTGVVAVCGLDSAGHETGLAASSFVGVSLDPPLVSICVQRSSTTWPRLAALPRLGLSVLAEDHGPLGSQLGSRSGDRFHGVDRVHTADGAVFISGASLWLECTPHSSLTGGDHEIVLLEVLGARITAGVRPLVFHASSFHALGAA